MQFSANPAVDAELLVMRSGGAPSRLHAVRHGKAVAPSRTLRRSVRPLCPARVARCGSRPCVASLRVTGRSSLRRVPLRRSALAFAPPAFPHASAALSRACGRSAARSRRGATPLSSTAAGITENHTVSHSRCPHGAGAQGQALAGVGYACVGSANPRRWRASRQRPRFAPSPHATTAGSVPKQTPPYPLRKHSSSGGVAG